MFGPSEKYTLPVSRPRKLPPQLLAKQYVSLSTHTASIMQTFQPIQGANEQRALNSSEQSLQ